METNGMYHIDGFAPITNLEYFPAEILIPIFAKIDDNTLLNLSRVSFRFQAIAQTIFKERYANKYLELREWSEESKQKSIELMNRIGMNVASVKVRWTKKIDENHWIIQMLNEHAKHIEKLKFCECYFIDLKSALSQQLHISHFTLKDCSGTLTMPDFRCLKYFEIDNALDVSEYKRIMRNNPNIECLRTNSLKAVAHISEYLSQLTELHITDQEEEFQEYETLSTITIDSIESLTLPFRFESLELLHLFSSKCKNLKKLELVQNLDDGDQVTVISDEFIAAVCTFSTVINLKITVDWIEYDDMLMFNGLGIGLPYLTHLYLEIYRVPFKNDFILPLVCDCRKAETIVIDYTDAARRDFEYDRITYRKDFHDEFLEITNNRSPNVRVEFRTVGWISGVITRKQLIWDNKLIYCIHADCNHSICTSCYSEDDSDMDSDY